MKSRRGEERERQTEEGIDAVPHEVVCGEEKVADCGEESDDGKHIHDAEVADGCWSVVGLARTHQRGRFVLGKHSVHPREGNQKREEKGGINKTVQQAITACSL